MSDHFVLRKGDRVVFLGDSITEQQLYTNYVEAYLASRYPELKLTFFNAGWGGDTAPGGCARLDRDVLALKPDVVTICYGMNDGGYCPLNPDILNRFNAGMRELVRRLKAAAIAHAYTREKDQLYFRLRRAVALNGGNAGCYNAPAHQEAIRLGPGLDRARERMIRKPALTMRLVVSPADQDAELLLGSDDGFALWLNGNPIGVNLEIGRWAQPDSDRFPVLLRKGRNILLVKITQNGGEWGFCVRFSGLKAPVWATRPGE